MTLQAESSRCCVWNCKKFQRLEVVHEIAIRGFICPKTTKCLLYQRNYVNLLASNISNEKPEQISFAKLPAVSWYCFDLNKLFHKKLFDKRKPTTQALHLHYAPSPLPPNVIAKSYNRFFWTFVCWLKLSTFLEWNLIFSWLLRRKNKQNLSSLRRASAWQKCLP